MSLFVQQALDRLDPHQRAAAEAIRGRKAPVIVLRASAGSGKTTTLVTTLGAMMMLDNVHPADIFATTFTKKAGEELVDRLKRHVPDSLVNAARIGTFHALALRDLRRQQEGRWGMERCIDIRSDVAHAKWIWKAIVDWAKEGVPGTHEASLQLGAVPDDYAAEAEYLRAQGLKPDTDEGAKAARLSPLLEFHTAWQMFEDAKAALVAWDFGDVLDEYRRLLEIGEIRLSPRYVMIDEAQDNNTVQLAIARALASDGTLVLVGDPRQCQPAGTMVATPMGPVAIESLRSGDRVISWSRREKHAYLMGHPVEVASRPYTGWLYRIQTSDGRTTVCTDTHRWLARWGDIGERTAVYLMRQVRPDAGECYRVGWCKILDESNGCRAAHYKLRARIEKAEAIWILSTFAERKFASAWESIVSSTYGIPTVMFEPAAGNMNYTPEILDLIWRHTAAQSRTGGAAALHNFGRTGGPLWTPSVPGGRQTVFECVGSNLHVGMMVPVWDGGTDYEWRDIVSVEKRWATDELVYSLDVEPHHSYVADGICTLNSIYRFRGATPEIFVEASQAPDTLTLDIPTNYRSGSKIVESGNRVAGVLDAAWRGTPAIASRSSTGTVDVRSFTDDLEEATMVAHEIAAGLNSGRKPEDYAILVRTNNAAGLFEGALMSASIPCYRMGGVPFFERSDVLAFVGYSVLAEADSWPAFERVLNRPKRFLSKAYLQDVAFQQTQGLDLLDAAKVALLKLRGKPEQGARDLHRFVTELRRDGWGKAPMRIAQMLTKDLPKEESDKNPDEDRTAVPLTCAALAGRFGNGLDFARYADAAAKNALQAQADQSTKGRVVISTCHRAKGLEWDTVFVSMPAGTFPHKRSIGNAVAMAEEARLAYVAFTRARNELFVTYPGYDMRGKERGMPMFVQYVLGL